MWEIFDSNNNRIGLIYDSAMKNTNMLEVLINAGFIVRYNIKVCVNIY